MSRAHAAKMLRKALSGLRFIKWNPIAVVCVARQRIRSQIECHIAYVPRLCPVYTEPAFRGFARINDSPRPLCSPIYRKLTDLISLPLPDEIDDRARDRL